MVNDFSRALHAQFIFGPAENKNATLTAIQNDLYARDNVKKKKKNTQHNWLVAK